MKKKLAATLSVVLILGLATLGILAYLTDTDSDVNVMTLGNVAIEQIEQERNADGKLQEFTGNNKDSDGNAVDNDGRKGLYPLTPGYDEGDLGEDNLWHTENNAVDKLVSVANTGESAAYVRTWFAFEYGNETVFEKVKLNINETDWTWDWDTATVEEIKGVKYYVVNAVYNKALAATDTPTEYSLKQVALDSAATNEDCETLDGNKNGTYDILVFSQAVQTAGFENRPADALKTAFGSAHPWNEGIASEEDLLKAIAEAKAGDVISVKGGTYDFTETDIVIDKGITLQAADPNSKPVFKVTTSDSGSINHGIEIKADNVKLINLSLVAEGSGSGNLVQISPDGTDFYSDIVIDGCEFKGSDHCIAMYGNNVTIQNCILDESTANDQGNIIYVWGTSGKLQILNNELIGKAQSKHGISFYSQSKEASRISGEIVIAGNTFRDVYKCIVHESSMTYTNVSVLISDNNFKDYLKKPVAIDNGIFASYTVTGNVFDQPDTGKIIIDNGVKTSITADKNYWGTENPVWGEVIEGSNVTVNNYYTDSAKTNLANK